MADGIQVPDGVAGFAFGADPADILGSPRVERVRWADWHLGPESRDEELVTLDAVLFAWRGRLGLVVDRRRGLVRAELHLDTDMITAITKLAQHFGVMGTLLPARDGLPNEVRWAQGDIGVIEAEDGVIVFVRATADQLARADSRRERRGRSLDLARERKVAKIVGGVRIGVGATLLGVSIPFLVTVPPFLLPVHLGFAIPGTVLIGSGAHKIDKAGHPPGFAGRFAVQWGMRWGVRREHPRRAASEAAPGW